MKRDSVTSIKKVSLCSQDRFAIATDESKEEKAQDDAPKDKYYFVNIVFILLGLMHVIPYSFFLTANAYWMHKFRNVSADITDTDARTMLQTHFSSVNGILDIIFLPVVTLLSTFFGHKIKTRVRVLITLGTISLSFITGTIFVKVDTDSWQAVFFGITIITLAFISCATAALTAANLSIVSKFPQHFMKIYLVGEGMGGLCSATLQILSLAMSPSTEVSALIYFVSGSALMTLSFALFYLSKYNKLFVHYANSVEEKSKKTMKISEARVLLKQVWTPLTSICILLLTFAPILPNVTTLVVSENYGSGSEWTDKYFVPVVTFLYNDIMGLSGRIVYSKLNKSIIGVSQVIFMVLRCLIFVPLIYFCNAQPRHHLPLLLPHDWQYIIVLGVFSFSSGYIISMLYLDVGRIVGKEKSEDAYLVMISCISVVSICFLPISMFSVDIL